MVALNDDPRETDATKWWWDDDDAADDDNGDDDDADDDDIMMMMIVVTLRQPMIQDFLTQPMQQKVDQNRKES